MSERSLESMIRELVAAMAIDRAYQMSGNGCLTCGLPATWYTDMGGKWWCDKHRPESLDPHGGEITPAVANAIRRLLKVASGE